MIAAINEHIPCTPTISAPLSLISTGTPSDTCRATATLTSVQMTDRPNDMWVIRVVPVLQPMLSHPHLNVRSASVKAINALLNGGQVLL